jgi:gamma-glutamylcyclotransferase (GGCT)/AIG2-like uncharacterized protein YtfP
VEPFTALREQLESEKRTMLTRWANREKQLDRAIASTCGLYGDLGGIIGQSLPTIEQLTASTPLIEKGDGAPVSSRTEKNTASVRKPMARDKSSSTDHPSAVFVYGTLKRGEAREMCWPRRPQAVDRATVHGTLYDLGPYPALAAGSDRVGGELWRFSVDDMAATLAALDEVEGYSGSEGDLYRRGVIECETAEGTSRAWTYYFTNLDELRQARRIWKDANGLCQWTPAPLMPEV